MLVQFILYDLILRENKNLQCADYPIFTDLTDSSNCITNTSIKQAISASRMRSE